MVVAGLVQLKLDIHRLVVIQANPTLDDAVHYPECREYDQQVANKNKEGQRT